jgi:hypothetical protein
MRKDTGNVYKEGEKEEQMEGLREGWRAVQREEEPYGADILPSMKTNRYPSALQTQ